MKSKKFKEDSEMSQPSAGQPSFTSGRKNDQIEEMSAGATGSGSVASVSAPIGKMQSRSKAGSSIFSGISTSEKFPNSKAVKEGQLSEEDIILMPGQGRKLKPGLMSKRHDNEVEMARNDLYQTEKDAKHVCDMLQSVSEMQGLDGWVQAKITKAADYLSSVRKYLEGKATQGVAEGSDEGLSKYSTDRLQAYVKKVSGGGVPAFGSGAKLKRVQAELKRREQGIAEGSGPKEKQKTPYRDINSPEYRAAADKQKQRMAKDKAAELGKKMLAKQGVAEGSLNEGQYEMMMRNGQVKKFIAKDDADAKRIAAGHGAKSVIRLRGGVPAGKIAEQGMSEMDSSGPKGRMKSDGTRSHSTYGSRDHYSDADPQSTAKPVAVKDFVKNATKILTKHSSKKQGVAEGWKSKLAGAAVTAGIDMYAANREKKKAAAQANANKQQDGQGVDEGSEKLTPREKFNRGLKRQGFDPEAAANRLEKLIAKQKAERDEFEKAMPDVYGKKEVDEEKEGLWANIHAKRERIKHGSGERMRKPGSKGAPTADALKKSAKE